jgi:hypothetical protein
MHVQVAKQIRTTLESRMRELEPALSEYEHLRGVLEALEDPSVLRRAGSRPALSSVTSISPRLAGASAAASSPGAIAPKRRRAKNVGTKPGVDGRAPQGANKQRVLAAIAEHPGITAAKVAELTGLKRTLVSATITRLKRNGELYAQGQGVRLPDIPPGPGVLSALNGNGTTHIA